MLTGRLIGIRPVGNPRLFLVSLTDLERAVIAITPLLVKVASRTKGDLTFPGIVRRLQASEWQLWLIGDPASSVLACFGTTIHLRDDGQKSCVITFLSGAGMRSWIHLLEEVEAWARRLGCIRMTITARKGFQRVLTDYRTYHVELEKDLSCPVQQ